MSQYAESDLDMQDFSEAGTATGGVSLSTTAANFQIADQEPAAISKGTEFFELSP